MKREFSIEEIPSDQTIARFSHEIQTSASGNDKAYPSFPGIVETFQVRFPLRVLMKLVKDDRYRRLRQSLGIPRYVVNEKVRILMKSLTHLGPIPIVVKFGMAEFLEIILEECRLSDLTGTGDEGHPILEKSGVQGPGQKVMRGHGKINYYVNLAMARLTIGINLPKCI